MARKGVIIDMNSDMNELVSVDAEQSELTEVIDNEIASNSEAEATSYQFQV